MLQSSAESLFVSFFYILERLRICQDCPNSKYSICSRLGLQSLTFLQLKEGLLFLDVFATLQKVAISFVISVSLFFRPSVRMDKLGSYCTNFHEIWYLRVFIENLSRKLVSLKSDKNNLYSTIRLIYVFDYFFLEWETFQTKFVEKIRTNILCPVTFFFRKSCHLWANVAKYCRAVQAPCQYGASALRAGYLRLQVHTFRLCNPHCFSFATRL